MKKIHFFYIALLGVFFSSCEKNKLSKLKDILYIERNDASMPAYIFGNGESKVFIILLHGGPGGSGLQYRSGNFEKYMEQSYAMVYWDQRSQGMTQGTNVTSEITAKNMVEDIKMLINTIKHKYGQDINVYLMGHSWGGYLGTAFLTADTVNQSLLRGWIEIGGAHDLPQLYSSSVNIFKEVSLEQMANNNNVDFWTEVYDYVKVLDTSVVNDEASLKMNKYAFDAEVKLQADDVVNPYDSSSSSATSKHAFFVDNYLTTWFIGLYANGTIWADVGNSSLTEGMKKVTIPSLFLWGKYDLVVPKSLGYKVYNVSGASYKKLRIFDRSGHSPFENEGHEFFTEVINFIERTN